MFAKKYSNHIAALVKIYILKYSVSHAFLRWYLYRIVRVTIHEYSQRCDGASSHAVEAGDDVGNVVVVKATLGGVPKVQEIQFEDDTRYGC